VFPQEIFYRIDVTALIIKRENGSKYLRESKHKLKSKSSVYIHSLNFQQSLALPQNKEYAVAAVN
jgi:hypothetical protein